MYVCGGGVAMVVAMVVAIVVHLYLAPRKYLILLS
jgi:hypothetical protein